ncbi:pyridoxal-phosphate dependent enzyme [Streptomyces sp. 4503]|uniref:Pyridoxal-phosphate dependent enzyme n=1 Tax=Streptomyces niphimycinicus TaxID=2842201 RepID=A0ABS6CCF1_9ACTN|nr:pyridoxal-phosphate dependent enzyme [Streptomyces niphimycinicus]MBU3864539.1 pyridoxal-phosphate dependent enzyme [Streptomyces niphimycinicus]
METLNPLRSFKGRGVDLFPRQAAVARHVVCASAGNFGQAMAYVGRARGIPVTVFAAHDANPDKVARMRELGAEVLLSGAGTIAVELAPLGLDAIVVPAGNGALISGPRRWPGCARSSTRCFSSRRTSGGPHGFADGPSVGGARRRRSVRTASTRRIHAGPDPDHGSSVLLGIRPKCLRRERLMGISTDPRRTRRAGYRLDRTSGGR